MKIGNLIASSVIALWGFGVLGVTAVGATSGAAGSGAYETGRIAGIVFAALLLVVGIGGISRELRKRSSL